MKLYIGIHQLEIIIFFTTSCRRQKYENYQQPLQRLQNSDFQIYFSVLLEISGTFLICFSLNNIRLNRRLFFF